MSLFAMQPALAQVETDAKRVAEFIGRFLKERKPPPDHHIVRRIDSMTRGEPGVRTDEFIASGESTYWKMEDRYSPQRPQVTRERLVMRDAGGRLLLWEDDRPVQEVTPEQARFANPLGFLSYPGTDATGLKLDVQGNRAVLDYTAGGRGHHVVLDLARGTVDEELVTGPGGGDLRRLRVERFDSTAGVDAAFFESVRKRLDAGSLQTTQRLQASGLLMWVLMLLGGLLPATVALVRYHRRLQAPVAGRMAVGVGVFAIGLPLIAWGMFAATKGMLSMMLTALTWPLVGGLPRDIAMAVSQGLNVLVLSALASSALYGLLGFLVLRRSS